MKYTMENLILFPKFNYAIIAGAFSTEQAK